MKRKRILGLVVIFALIVSLTNNFSAFAGGSKGFEGHKFPELGYAYNALEPNIDAQTMEIHYSRHHKTYFTNFMTAAEGTDLLKSRWNRSLHLSANNLLP